MIFRSLIASLAFAVAAALSVPASAMPLANGSAADVNSANPMIIKVGSRHHRRARGHYNEYGYVSGTTVNAPYTHVQGSRGKVIVDAPYAYVKRSRSRGVTVRAPYVDIRIP